MESRRFHEETFDSHRTAYLSTVPLVRTLRIGFVFRSKADAGSYPEDCSLMKRIIRETKRGARVDVLDFQRYEASVQDLGGTLNGICTMARNPTALSLLSSMELRGIPCVNSVAAVRNCLDRASMLTVLRHHKIPIPDTSIHRRAFRTLSFPAMLKNTVSTGVRGRRTLLVRSRKDLYKYSAPLRNGLWIGQKLVHEVLLTKVYVIRNEVIGVRDEGLFRKSNVIDHTALDREKMQTCLSCGQLLGLDLFDVDLLSDREHTYVIDVNDFPSFSGLSKAPSMIANYLLEKFEREA